MSDVSVRETGKMGRGVFATRNFQMGEYIFGYEKGKIVPEDQVRHLSEWEQDHVDELDDNLREVLVEPACYVNHSCDPNAILKGREYYALREIAEGDEVCVDYRTKAFDDFEWPCTCGTANCTGKVRHNFFSLPKKMQKLYLPFTLAVIREEYEKRHSGNCT